MLWLWIYDILVKTLQHVKCRSRPGGRRGTGEFIFTQGGYRVTVVNEVWLFCTEYRVRCTDQVIMTVPANMH